MKTIEHHDARGPEETVHDLSPRLGLEEVPVIVLDHLSEAQKRRFLFQSFQRLSSACAVVRAFREAKLLFPRRLRGGPLELLSAPAVRRLLSPGRLCVSLAG
jgi:hypothetical protein